MEKITTAEGLRAHIQVLENQRRQQEAELKLQFKNMNEAMKPSKLLVSAIKDITSSPEIRTGILDGLMGMGAGLLSKKVLVGSTSNPIKGLLGNAIEGIVAVLVSKNADTIKEGIGGLIQKLFSKKEDNTTPQENNTPDERD